MTSLVDRLLPSQLWARIQPRLPPPPPRPRGGVPRHVPDRNCVAALLFMARTSTPWNLLPAKELGCGSATTCWRRLDEWARAGVFEQLQAVLLDELGEAGRPDLERVLVDSASVRAVKGGADRRKSGRPRQAGDQAAPGRRRWRPAPCRGAHRRQRPTRPCLGPWWTTSRRSACPLAGDAAGRAPSTPTRATTTHAAARSCDAVGSPPHRPAPRGVLAAAWPPPLADRADDRLAAWLAAAAGPLRAL